jgi:FkbM family methyltransferase
MEVKLAVRDGHLMMPSSIKLPDGRPRFVIAFPQELSNDIGARYLVLTDASPAGYEPPTRILIEQTLRPGDLFVDVGAHWGFYTLQAATHPAGNIHALAFEPDPSNASILFGNVLRNGLEKVATVVSAACGDRPDIAPLVSNSSMMHSIRGVGLKPPFTQGPAKWVPVVALDDALSKFSFSGRRVILKIDAEGYEPQVVAGARSLLSGGACALLIWEHGNAFADGPERAAMQATMAALTSWGFTHLRPPSQHAEGPLVPFVPSADYQGNVFSVRSAASGASAG